jgi:hypothetical protein
MGLTGRSRNRYILITTGNRINMSKFIIPVDKNSNKSRADEKTFRFNFI